MTLDREKETVRCICGNHVMLMSHLYSFACTCGTSVSLSTAPSGQAPLEGVNARLWWFLHILANCGGSAPASDEPWEWVRAFCFEVEGRDPDTFNIAAAGGFTRVTHDSDTDNSTVYITEKGRSALLPASAESLRHDCAASGFHDHDGCTCTDAELRSREASPASGVVEAGWQLVPKEPTDAMIEAAAEWISNKASWGGQIYGSDVWEQMLSAAPTEGR